MKQIKKEHLLFQGLKEDRRKVSQNLGDLQNLLIKLTVLKPAQKKRDYIMSFHLSSLNPSDKPNLAQT